MRNVLAGLMAVILCVGAMLPVQAAEPKTGDVPPALLGKDREGDVVDLAQHRGKVVVVTFWPRGAGPAARNCRGWMRCRSMPATRS